MQNPPRITVHELKTRLDRGTPLCLVDVRGPGERAVAPFPGAIAPDEPDAAERIENLGRDDLVVIVCHHGTRSDAAALYWRARGFTRVFSLAAGIEAWFSQIDPAVPRY